MDRKPGEWRSACETWPFSWHLKVEVQRQVICDITLYPPGNWHILPWEKENHGLKHALGGDILVPRRASVSTKKLYVIVSFCTRTYRTLIFPLALSSTIYVPISLSLLKLQEKHQSFRILMYKSSHVLVKSLVKWNDQWIYHGIWWHMMQWWCVTFCVKHFFALFLSTAAEP